MTEDQRMESIKGALKTLKDEFLKDPTLFFTEQRNCLNQDYPDSTD